MITAKLFGCKVKVMSLVAKNVLMCITDNEKE